MDWNLKAPSWDLGDVDEANLPNMETMDESSRFGVYRVKGEFSVDLKLGQVGNSGTEVSALPQMHKDASSAAVVSKMAPPAPSGSSKRARAINNSTVTVSCLVDGCNSDLSNCRDYHRRHKVCELHSKTPEVTIGGLKQRFCQQCSRFHSLEQFDERKRSCRKRLDGHNRRRRKPQPEPLTRPGSFLSNYQGTHLLPFSSSSGMVNPSWSTGGLVTSSAGGITRMHIHNNQHQQVHVVDHKQDLFLGTTPTSYRDQGKQLAFLHGDHNTLNNHQNPNPHLPVASSVCQTLLRSSPLSSESSCGNVRSKLMFCDNNNNNSITSAVHDTPCALSLLSSSSQTHTPGNGLNQMVQVQPHHSMSLMQPLGLSLHGNNNSYESMERVLVHNGSESDHHCSSMYNMGSDGSQGNDAPQLFPYQWD